MFQRFLRSRFGQRHGQSSSTPGVGRGRRRGAGQGQGGGGRGGGDKPGSGPEGNCVCPSCGHKEPHVAGQRCLDQICPKCGTKMTRE